MSIADPVPFANLPIGTDVTWTRLSSVTSSREARKEHVVEGEPPGKSYPDNNHKRWSKHVLARTVDTCASEPTLHLRSSSGCDVKQASIGHSGDWTNGTVEDVAEVRIAQPNGYENETSENSSFAMNGSKPSNDLPLNVESSRTPIIAGLPVTIIAHLNESIRGQQAEICVKYTSDCKVLYFERIPADVCDISVPIRPPYPGTLQISLKTKHQLSATSSDLEVKPNLPIISFNEAAHWPVASAYDRFRNGLFVAYNQHISVFSADGEFVCGLLDLGGCYYNDISINSTGSLLAATVSGWDSQETRFQELHIYDISDLRKASLLQAVDRAEEKHKLECSLLCVTFMTSDTILIGDADGLCVYSIKDEQLVDRLPMPKMGCINRLAYRKETIYIADPVSSCIIIADSSGHVLRRLMVCNEMGELSPCIRGLAVDDEGRVIVSDCTTGRISVYNKANDVICTIDNKSTTWPLHVSAGKQGQCFVAAHGELCIFKFTYL